ncbi:MAG TPA: hypothetical protein VLR90_02300 [Blastocatellia bacterium]|nr:hypothetical protein [Blastocatellia bacterium]
MDSNFFTEGYRTRIDDTKERKGETAAPSAVSRVMITKTVVSSQPSVDEIFELLIADHCLDYS